MKESHSMEWFVYVTAVVGTLAFKLGKYIYEDRQKWLEKVGAEDTLGAAQKGKFYRWQPVAINWFFEVSWGNGVSWVTTIFVILVVGGAYISRLDGYFGEYFEKIPLHWTVAGLIGSLAELYVPNIVKRIVGVTG